MLCYLGTFFSLNLRHCIIQQKGKEGRKNTKRVTRIGDCVIMHISMAFA